MLIVPRASTHLEYTDIALLLPASRYGQAFTSVYVQRWLGRYMKHRRTKLLAPASATSSRWTWEVGADHAQQGRSAQLLLLLRLRAGQALRRMVPVSGL